MSAASRRIVAWLAALCVLASCRTAIEGMAPAEELEVAKRAVALTAAGDARALEAMVVPEIRNAQLGEAVRLMQAQFPAEAARSVSVVSWTTSRNFADGTTFHNFWLEYAYEDGWLAAQVVLRRVPEQAHHVYKLHVQRMPLSLREHNRFALAGKGPIHYFTLAACAAVLAVVIYALVLCRRTPIPRRKWLWYLFIALPVGQFTLNWTTGQWMIQPFYVNLLGVGFARASDYTPVMVWFSFPLGAIVFLWRRRRYLERSAASDAAEPDSAADPAR